MQEIIRESIGESGLSSKRNGNILDIVDLLPSIVFNQRLCKERHRLRHRFIAGPSGLFRDTFSHSVHQILSAFFIFHLHREEDVHFGNVPSVQDIGIDRPQ